ncbi:sequence-specific DNA binding transcription factor [Hibiscus syriacus]|uniref:Sequence-specific DNA binding transcription factor n=1 Tax=Hibiscus syriacus TaxID=106335 RepID=A0A6A2Y650_HIBSY|nr:sequence-specific DNA binding transcription factor [Hibiscus syriacus]
MVTHHWGRRVRLGLGLLEPSVEAVAADVKATKHKPKQIGELHAVKQELRKLRQDCNASLEVKIMAFNQTEEAKDSAKVNIEKVGKLSKKISSLQAERKLVEKYVESLKLEIESLKKEHSELQEKEREAESIAENLHVQIQKSKSELEAFLVEESKTRGSCEKMISTLQQLMVEMEKSRQEAEGMKKEAEKLKSEAEAAKMALEEAGKQLSAVLEEVEVEKEAEIRALDQIKMLSERATAARYSTSESGANITIFREEFEPLSHKVATAGALKSAEMAEAEKRAVEGKLRRWRERIQDVNPPEKIIHVQKLDKERPSVSKKVLLPNISGILNRRKNQIEGGTPSYLPARVSNRGRGRVIGYFRFTVIAVVADAIVAIAGEERKKLEEVFGAGAC